MILLELKTLSKRAGDPEVSSPILHVNLTAALTAACRVNAVDLNVNEMCILVRPGAALRIRIILRRPTGEALGAVLVPVGDDCEEGRNVILDVRQIKLTSNVLLLRRVGRCQILIQ